jgi:hypothetical protein
LFTASFPQETDLGAVAGEGCVTINDVPGIDAYKDTAFNCARYELTVNLMALCCVVVMVLS